MQLANRWALKEWASVCAAVAHSRQTVLLRKGGLHEGVGGFQVQHSEFWLYPTRFHQNADELVPEAAGLLDDPAAAPPPAGIVRLSLYAIVRRVHHLDVEADLQRFRGAHVLSDAALAERFHYRKPGLFAIEIDASVRQTPHAIAERPDFAGCHSWVDTGAELSTSGLRPVSAE